MIETARRARPSEIDAVRHWLRDRWGVELDLSGAVAEPPHDPRVPYRNPFPTLGLREKTRRDLGIGSDFVTWFMAKAILRNAGAIRGREVWEMGSGAGILSSLCARLGARRVRATDVFAPAVECTRKTAELNGVEIDSIQAKLFDVPWRTRPDVLIADLPQKPVRGLRYPLNEHGGLEGTDLLLPFLDEARRRLAPGGRLYFYLHTLPHPEAMRAIHARFRARVVAWMPQIFHRQTLREILPYLRERREAGTSWFQDLPDGRFSMVCFAFAADRP